MEVTSERKSLFSQFYLVINYERLRENKQLIWFIWGSCQFDRLYDVQSVCFGVEFLCCLHHYGKFLYTIIRNFYDNAFS